MATLENLLQKQIDVLSLRISHISNNETVENTFDFEELKQNLTCELKEFVIVEINKIKMELENTFKIRVDLLKETFRNELNDLKITQKQTAGSKFLSDIKNDIKRPMFVPSIPPKNVYRQNYNDAHSLDTTLPVTRTRADNEDSAPLKNLYTSNQGFDLQTKRKTKTIYQISEKSPSKDVEKEILRFLFIMLYRPAQIAMEKDKNEIINISDKEYNCLLCLTKFPNEYLIFD